MNGKVPVTTIQFRSESWVHDLVASPEHLPSGDCFKYHL